MARILTLFVVIPKDASDMTCHVMSRHVMSCHRGDDMSCHLMSSDMSFDMAKFGRNFLIFVKIVPKFKLKEYSSL